MNYITRRLKISIQEIHQNADGRELHVHETASLTHNNPGTEALVGVEHFLRSQVGKMPAREELAQAQTRQRSLELELDAANIRATVHANQLRDARNELEQWRDYAVALDADRLARNFAVSKKCDRLDPRNKR